MIAVEQSSVETVGFLLSQSADPTSTRNDGQAAFDLVTDGRILELLESTKSIDEPDESDEQEELPAQNTKRFGFF